MIGIAAALAAAVAFGWSAALMHHSAFRAPSHVQGTRALLRHLVGQRTWLAGMAASLIGFLLHALALKFGSLAIVQPLVVSGLVFSFIFRALLERRSPHRELMGWVSVSAVGLGLFVIAAGAIRGSSQLDGSAAAVMFAAGAAIAGAALLAAPATTPRNTGVLLGISAGVVFGLIAGTIKRCEPWHPAHVVAAVRSRAAGVVAFLLNQRAYHRAPLSTSLPALNLANPLVAVAFGIAAFHERPSSDPGAILAETLGLAGVLVGIFFLARHGDPAVAR